MLTFTLKLEMEVLKIIIATLIGTTVMTAFSYYISEKFDKLFKEPVLLNYLMVMAGLNLKGNLEKLAGWVLHYFIGLLFVIAYNYIWKLYELSWLSALYLGIGSGIVGIVSWIIMFSMSSATPKVHFKEYYLQLFFAHIFFAFAVTATYKIFEMITTM